MRYFSLAIYFNEPTAHIDNIVDFPMQTISLTDSQKHYGRGNLALLLIDNEYGSAVVSLQGGQLLSYRRKRDQREFLWLSDDAIFEEGKAIRGGVPICLPWFGPKQGKPQHGFARSQLWQQRDGESHFDFSGTSEHFNHRFCADLRMEFTDELTLTLTVTNLEDRAMPLSWALHSYHPVADIHTARIQGLDGFEYLDNTRGLNRARQVGDVEFAGETDRAYLSVGDRQTIAGAFEVIADNAASAVVWNPGEALAEKMSDLSDYRYFVCLERGQVFEDANDLGPNKSTQASVIVRAL
ncbi:MAG: D-hexose-6-phosphate mutarotase [Cellvibrionaceae bacterium]|nr:D-hexose-6-phosphate mutarotase [Cellvibrionaceae bacterium]|tara:strand:- start:22286 stop:23173 length:888 start_codon:yes stop_codon:yes gene_type:complete